MNESLLAYVPMDRLHAMARGETLPERASGSVLFADISGFTPLTEALERELGPQRGAEELTIFLNQVYDALINELHRWGGSAIAFAGDAVTCWFDGDDGVFATATAMAMQEAMGAFTAVETSKGSVIELSMKAAVAAGPVRRFLVGDPQSRVIEVLAGATVERLAAAENEANRGDVVLAPCAYSVLEGRVRVREIRMAEDGRLFYVIDGLTVDPEPPQIPELAIENLHEEEIRAWLLPAVYRRLNRGLGDFLAEIRSTVAVFVRFPGIDYDKDEEAGAKLYAMIRVVQEIADYYQGTLISLNIGDKGSYLNVTFGAPLTHENDVARAASAALELRDLPKTFGFLDPLQIGISGGQVRAGAYGGKAHRTYGVMGDSVNLSARLMMASEPGTVLVSMNVQEQIDDLFEWDILTPIRVKGKSEPVPVAILKAIRPRIGMHLPESDESELLVGRDAEVTKLAEVMDSVLSGEGQVVSFVGEAGLGKSRMVAKALAMAEERGFLIFGGEAESHGMNSSYLVWHPILRGLFGLDPTRSQAAQIRTLRNKIGEIDVKMVQRVPVLGPAFQLSIPDNDLTDGFDAKLRKSLLESMLLESLTFKANESPMVLVLEDCHWLDALSYDLLEEIARRIDHLPVLIIVTFRNMDSENDRGAPVSALGHYSEMELSPLTQEDLTLLAQFRLERITTKGRDAPATESLARRIAQQAEGNPFYLEELVNYVGNEASDVDPDELSELALPSSLRGLVLSRLDQLPERPKTVLKVASIIGRVFHASWLEGIYPELGGTDDIVEYMQELCQQKFTVFDPAEGEDTYYFRSIVTRGVIYDSLLHKMRTALHEQTGYFLETTYVEAQDQYLDLLAYHYDHSPNQDKKRTYLRRAGEFAQRSYANQAAISYFGKVLPLVPPKEQIEIMLKVGEVEQLIGQWDEARDMYQEAITLAKTIDDLSAAGRGQAALGELLRLQGNYTEASNSLNQASITFEQNNNQVGLAQVLHYSGTVAAQQGELELAEARYLESLALRRELDDQVGITSLLNNLAIISEYRGDYEESRQRHEEALAIRRELGDRRAVAFSLTNVGHILSQLGDYAGARGSLEEAVALHREVGDQYLLATTLDNLGNAVRAQGDYNEARHLYTESLAITQELGDGWAAAYLLEDVARLIHLLRESSDALVLLSAAKALRTAIDAPLPTAEQEALDDLQKHVQDELGWQNSQDCVAAGQEMSMVEAITFAKQIVTSDR